MDMENTIGLILQFTKETSNKASDMGMEFGKTRLKYTKVTIDWIKNKGLEYIFGKVSRFIKGSSKTIFDRVMDNFLVLSMELKKIYIGGVGLEARRTKKGRWMKMWSRCCICF